MGGFETQPHRLRCPRRIVGRACSYAPPRSSSRPRPWPLIQPGECVIGDSVEINPAFLKPAIPCAAFQGVMVGCVVLHRQGPFFLLEDGPLPDKDGFKLWLHNAANMPAHAWIRIRKSVGSTA